MRKQLVLVEGLVPGSESPGDAHPEHPIYIPVDPPPESGLSPEHPIYLPVYPDQGLPGDQPGIDNSLPGSQPRPDNTLPGSQPRPDNTLPGDQPHPSHPIYLPAFPDNTLPGDQPRPDQGLPGDQPRPEHPIYYPVEPTHPIELPPEVDGGLTDEQKEALVSFLTGNLPPFSGPETPTPV